MRLFSAVFAIGLATGWLGGIPAQGHQEHGQGHQQGQPAKPMNPAAITSVGEKLAADLQGKPVVVQIKSRHCPMCRAMEPTLAAVKARYRGRVTFVTLDVTDGASLRAAERLAAQVGLQNFFRAHQTRTGLILAVNPASGAVWEQFRAGTPETQIVAVLDRAIAELAEQK